MPRRRPAPKRPVIADPVYGFPPVSQLVSKTLLDGKRIAAQSIVHNTLEDARIKTGQDPVQTLKRTLDSVKPSIEVKSRRVSGATYQMSTEAKSGCQTIPAMCWLVSFSRTRRKKIMAEQLMNKILDASNGLGTPVKHHEDTHKIAKANRVFAHYRWRSPCPRVFTRGPLPLHRPLQQGIERGQG